ncbi:hypothetical protein ACTA71_008941 [Dictyostelium dimigraforme]
MKVLSLLFLAICLISLINADVYTNSVDFGAVSKSKFASQTFPNIGLPSTSSFNLEGIQVVILNKTSNETFNHNFISTCSVDFTSSGKKIVSFSASNIQNQLVFPSPYLVQITGSLDLTVSIYTLNVEPQDISISYYMKWEENSGSKTIVKLTRTASSVVSNYSTFSVPQGSGGFTIQNSIPWISNAEAMNFQASVSAGIISLSFIEQMNGQNTVVCKSVPTYNGKFLVKMSGCDNVVSLYKGATYVTLAVYNNTTPLKNVIGNFGFYVGFPTPSTTGGSSGPSTSATTGGHSSGPSTTTGGHSSGPSTTGGHSSGPSTHGSSTGGGGSSGPSTSSSSHATSGHHGSHSQSESGSQSQSESGSQSPSESGSQSDDSSFTTTTAGSQSDSFPDSSDGPSYTSGSSGSSGTYMWNGKGVKIDIF